MISTNTVKPKENHRFDKFLEEQVIDGKPTGNIISHIPRRVLTTSQEEVRDRKLPLFPSVFPGVKKVDQKKPAKTFIQSRDLRDIERQKKAVEVKAQAKAVKANASKKKAGRKGRKTR